MPRPSRSLEALAVLRTYYRERGVLPTIEVLTELMGYRSPGSTYPVVKALVASKHLEQEGKGGRLKPGLLFFEKPDQSAWPHIQLPHGRKSVLVTVANKALGVLVGDVLVYAPTTEAAPGDVVVIQKDSAVSVALITSIPLPAGFLGVLQLQYRTY